MMVNRSGLFAAAVLCALSLVAGVMASPAAGVTDGKAPPTCFGLTATKVGTVGAETIRGTPGNDVIVGRGGDDIIYGRGGDDRICGNGGNDTIEGGPGSDRVQGGVGNDRITGGGGRDALKGGRGSDVLRGRSGDDTLRGQAGNDVLRGQGGDDTLEGGAGTDKTVGGQGTDSCHGETRISCEWPIVRAVVFFSPLCGYCHYVIGDLLMPVWFPQYGGEPVWLAGEPLSEDVVFSLATNGTLEILLVNSLIDEGNQFLWQSAGELGISGSITYPLLVVDDEYHFGPNDVPDKFPGIIEESLASDGIDWPALTGLPAILAGIPGA